MFFNFPMYIYYISLKPALSQLMSHPISPVPQWNFTDTPDNAFNPQHALATLGQTTTKLGKDFILLIKCTNLFSSTVLLEVHPMRLKNMTRGSYKPRLVRKVAFRSSPSFIQTLLKPHQTSNFVKYLAPWSFAISSGIKGSGYLFFMVMAFSVR